MPQADVDREDKLIFLRFVREGDGLDVFDPWKGRPARVNLQEPKDVAEPNAVPPDILDAIRQEQRELADALAGQVLAIQARTRSQRWTSIRIVDAIRNRALLGTNVGR